MRTLVTAAWVFEAACRDSPLTTIAQAMERIAESRWPGIVLLYHNQWIGRYLLSRSTPLFPLFVPRQLPLFLVKYRTTEDLFRQQGDRGLSIWQRGIQWLLHLVLSTCPRALHATPRLPSEWGSVTSGPVSVTRADQLTFAKAFTSGLRDDLIEPSHLDPEFWGCGIYGLQTAQRIADDLLSHTTPLKGADGNVAVGIVHCNAEGWGSRETKIRKVLKRGGSLEEVETAWAGRMGRKELMSERQDIMLRRYLLVLSSREQERTQKQAAKVWADEQKGMELESAVREISRAARALREGARERESQRIYPDSIET